MSDISTLIMNEIRNSLENLSRKGVGFINSEHSNTIQYQIDGRLFSIVIKELENMDELDQWIARFKTKKYADINLIIDERTRKWKD